MSEAASHPETGVDAKRTGVPSVDEVLASVDALGDAPLEEHVTVYGAAHDALRRALDADPGA